MRKFEGKKITQKEHSLQTQANELKDWEKNCQENPIKNVVK